VRGLVAVMVILLSACDIPTTVKVGEWSALCEGVGTGDCMGVAALFVNNLAWSEESVFIQSRGIVSITPRPACPTVPDYADPAFCWQATALVPSGPICMVVAKSRVAGPLGFGQVGGDDLTGRLGPPPDWPRCT